MVAFAGAAIGALALAIAATDRRRFIIPDHLSALLALAGLAALAGGASLDDLVAEIASAATRAAVFGSLVWATAAIYLRVRGIEGLGFGDVKLAAASGCLLTAEDFGWSLVIACLAAGAALVVTRALPTMRRRWRRRLPLGAFWAPAIWLMWLAEHLAKSNGAAFSLW